MSRTKCAPVVHSSVGTRRIKLRVVLSQGCTIRTASVSRNTQKMLALRVEMWQRSHTSTERRATMSTNKFIQDQIRNGILKRVEYEDRYNCQGRVWSEHTRVVGPLACFNQGDLFAVLLSLTHFDRVLKQRLDSGDFDPSCLRYQGGCVLDLPSSIERHTVYMASNGFLPLMATAIVAMSCDTFIEVAQGIPRRELEPLAMFRHARVQGQR